LNNLGTPHGQGEDIIRVLGEVLAAVPDAILIGGWASWVRLNGMISHDIDLLASRADLAQIQFIATDVSESRHIAGRKWRAERDGVHLDLYVPYESRLGQRLELRTEVLTRHAERYEGYRLLTVDAHIATKLAALLDRADSQPGQKDRRELRKLLALGGSETPRILMEASPRSPRELAALMEEAFEYLTESEGVDRAERSDLRNILAAWLQELG
jgi:hypothetical protein